MPELIDVCLDFIKNNMQEIVQKSEVIPTYKSHIAKKLARKIDIRDLNELIDPKDLLLSRLYKKKLELFFEDQMNLLHRCTLCNDLFTIR
jgi:deoxyadenosine/deoxycytidine kinase